EWFDLRQEPAERDESHPGPPVVPGPALLHLAKMARRRFQSGGVGLEPAALKAVEPGARRLSQAPRRTDRRQSILGQTEGTRQGHEFPEVEPGQGADHGRVVRPLGEVAYDPLVPEF